MLGKAIQPEIEAMIQAGQFDELREMLDENLDAADIAEILEDLEDEDRALIFRLLPIKIASEVFEQLEFESQEDLIAQLSQERVARILNEMAPDDRTSLLEELPGEVVHRLLRSLSAEEMRVARSLLGYPEDSIGRLMTPEFISVNPNWSVQHCFDHIRQNAARVETINVIYVLDDRGRLVDDLKIGQLLLADPSSRVGDLCDEQVISLPAYGDQEEAVKEFKKYDRVALPVTDSRGVMVGIVTVDDVLDVAEEEETEDALKFGGQTAIEFSYFATPMHELLRKRGGWLTILLVSSFLTVMAMDYFESFIETLTILAFFVPMIVSTGGNSGTQSAALMIRGLAVHEIELSRWWLVFLRELGMGLCLGLFMGLLAGGFSYMVQYNTEKLDQFKPTRTPRSLQVSQISAPLQAGAPEVSATTQDPADSVKAAADEYQRTILREHPFRLPFLVLLSVTCVVTLGTLVGSMLPFIFKSVGLDPAVCSGPFISTFVDVSGITIFFVIFRWLYHAYL